MPVILFRAGVMNTISKIILIKARKLSIVYIESMRNCQTYEELNVIVKSSHNLKWLVSVCVCVCVIRVSYC